MGLDTPEDNQAGYNVRFKIIEPNDYSSFLFCVEKNRHRPKVR